MVVVDASVVLDALLRTDAVVAQIIESPVELHAPVTLDAEVLHALRRKWLSGAVSLEKAEAAVVLLPVIPITRHSLEPFIERMWQLRHNITAYDAGYVALAESLGVPLLTRDRRLSRASAHAARVEYIA